MNASAASSARLRREMSGLLDRCPVEDLNPEDCPLFKVRRLDRASRRRWFDALSTEDLRYLAAYHYTCERALFRRTPTSAAGAEPVAV